MSSAFITPGGTSTFGPPLIGALLRMPVDVVRQRMLERLHEHGFDDLVGAHLGVLQYPGPQGLRPSDLATQLRMSKQALNYLLGNSSASATSNDTPTRRTGDQGESLSRHGARPPRT